MTSLVEIVTIGEVTALTIDVADGKMPALVTAPEKQQDLYGKTADIGSRMK